MRASSQVSQPRVWVAVAFAALCVLWGSMWLPLGVLAQSGVPALFAMAARFLIAGLLLAATALAFGHRWPRGNQLKAVLVLGMTMFALPYGIALWSEQRVSFGLAAVLYATMPLCAATLGPLLGGRSREEMPASAIPRMIAGLGGVALAVYGVLSFSLSQAAGAVGVLISVLLISGSSVYAKRELASLSPVAGAAVQLLAAGAAMGLASAFLERGQRVAWSRESMEALLVASVLGSAVAYSVYYWLLRRMEPYKLAATQLVVPLLVLVEGLAALREHPPWTFASGAVLALGSAWFVVRSRAEDDRPITLSAGANREGNSV